MIIDNNLWNEYFAKESLNYNVRESTSIFFAFEALNFRQICHF